MHITNLRKVGGSVMLAVPPALLDLLHLKAGTSVGVAVDGGRLVVEASPQRRYSMAELLAASDYSEGPTPEDREWLDAPAVGKEIL
jgi:antitoxin ChpS